MSMRQLKITKSITNRASQSLEKYLQEIGKVELISPEEEVKLALLIKQGDEKALDKLTNANLRFVVSVAKQYQNQGLSLPDLINEGNLGLIKAAERFDETRGFKFISYAVWWIRQSILQALAEQSRIVRLPLNKVGLTNRIQKAYSQLEQEYNREPSPEELAEVLGLDTDEISASLNIGDRNITMDTEEGTLMDVLENPNSDRAEKNIEHVQSLKTEIGRSLTALTERQKDVICYFFGIGIDHPMSLEDIGERFNLTRERVRQIKDKAITKLRTANRLVTLKKIAGVEEDVEEDLITELGTIKDQTVPGKPITDIVKNYLQRNASVNSIAWAILGGKEILPEEPISGFDFISVSHTGLKKQSVIYLAEIINVSMKDVSRLLNVSFKTLSLQKMSDILDPLTSSLLIEITLTIAKGLSVFEDINKLNHWLFNENKALKGMKPFELLNTPTGIKMVSRVLGRIEEGVYT